MDGQSSSRRKVSAIQIVQEADGSSDLGLLTQLDAQSPLEVCGPGFDDRTVKVRSGDSFYYVFREDVEAVEYGSRTAFA